MKTIADELREHPFFSDFTEEDLNLVAGCGKNVIFKANQMIAKEGDAADTFYLIRHGRMVVEMATPGKTPLLCQSIGSGQVCGWSWLFDPYVWSFDVRAQEETRAIALDGKCLREKCQKDYRLGYFLMRKFSEIMTSRLQHTRMQLMDVYGTSK